jgi:hypothetical protein
MDDWFSRGGGVGPRESMIVEHAETNKTPNGRILRCGESLSGVRLNGGAGKPPEVLQLYKFIMGTDSIQSASLVLPLFFSSSRSAYTLGIGCSNPT